MVRQQQRIREPLASSLIVNTVLVLAAVYFLLPLVWVLVAATKSPGELFTSFGLGITDSPQAWENLTRVFTQDKGIFTTWVLNSLLYSAVGALAATIISAACGYALAKFNFKGRELLFSSILGGVLVPATVIALPLYFLLNAIDLTGTYWSVLLPSMVSPFGVYLARIHANAAVPDEVVEAARIDGAGNLRIFGSIASRMMTPALVTIFLFQFVTIWNNYLLPLVMLNETKTFPLTLGLTLWNSQTQVGPNVLPTRGDRIGAFGSFARRSHGGSAALLESRPDSRRHQRVKDSALPFHPIGPGTYPVHPAELAGKVELVVEPYLPSYLGNRQVGRI